MLKLSMDQKYLLINLKSDYVMLFYPYILTLHNHHAAVINTEKSVY